MFTTAWRVLYARRQVHPGSVVPPAMRRGAGVSDKPDGPVRDRRYRRPRPRPSVEVVGVRACVREGPDVDRLKHLVVADVVGWGKSQPTQATMIMRGVLLRRLSIYSDQPTQQAMMMEIMRGILLRRLDDSQPTQETLMAMMLRRKCSQSEPSVMMEMRGRGPLLFPSSCYCAYTSIEGGGRLFDRERLKCVR